MIPMPVTTIRRDDTIDSPLFAQPPILQIRPLNEQRPAESRPLEKMDEVTQFRRWQ
jgi:hypothetical protein